MPGELEDIGRFIVGMKAIYDRGGNAMEYARNESSSSKNSIAATMIAYDLQAGTYVEHVKKNPSFNEEWTDQLAALLKPHLPPEGGTVLEVGAGEATSLAGVARKLGAARYSFYGFDISWSRVEVGRRWANEQSVAVKLFVANLMNIPLRDDSVDVVYSSHSLEPNGGREKEALAECLRIARHAVILVEPIYELATPEAQSRMEHHGYVRRLKETAEMLGAKVMDYRLLETCSNPLNPSGALVLKKAESLKDKVGTIWRCPLTGANLLEQKDHFLAPQTGIAYPTLLGIPLLRAEHAVVAFKLTL